ncbi:MAG: hypothetical protein QG656_895, partial [Candidatus Hydrogenedentes bacterium]|nr:hypothetical protein [Candidatus Hydrogenedentota bacterium]
MAGAALMAWKGADIGFERPSLLFLLGYWTLFLALLIAAGYTAVLDVRYIRLQYQLGRREVFLQTLGNEEFRKLVRAARSEERR